MSSIHRFSVQSISGGVIDFADFAGKKILVVNVASACGYTPQYAQLQELFQIFSSQLVVVGCPCNDFGHQEPGTAEEIQSFCQLNYGVTFPLTARLSILGDHPHPLYQWLMNKAENGVSDNTVMWNFHKFLLDENGQLIASFPSAISPLDEAILAFLDHPQPKMGQ